MVPRPIEPRKEEARKEQLFIATNIRDGLCNSRLPRPSWSVYPHYRLVHRLYFGRLLFTEDPREDLLENGDSRVGMAFRRVAPFARVVKGIRSGGFPQTVIRV